MPINNATRAHIQPTALFALSLGVYACGSAIEAPDDAILDSVEQAVNINGDMGPAAALTQQPGFINCSALPEYKAVQLGALAPTASYQRPDGCPGWSGLEAHFTVPTTLAYRKLYVTSGFTYTGAGANAKAHCLASKIEYETFRQVEVAGHNIWLPLGQHSSTPHFVDSTQLCYWHNFNYDLTYSTPGSYIERIRTRGVRYNGSIVNVLAAARMQADSVP